VIVGFSDRQANLKLKRQLFRDPKEVRRYEKSTSVCALALVVGACGGSGTNTFNDDPRYLGLDNIVLVEGTLADDGSFAGKIENEGNTLTIGDFAGIIGGDAGQALAGGTRFETFTDAYENEIEYGVFVLDICEVGDTGTICTNSLPD